MAHKNESNWSPYKARQKDKKTEGKPTSGKPPLRGRHRKPTENYTFAEADDRIRDIFDNHGLGDLSHEKRNQLTRFYEMLMKNQEKENFTRLLSLRDIAIKHFVDCLHITKLTQFSFPLLDVGTGPGFPGIPLKIFFPEQKIILAEGVQKRVDFLKRVRDELKLENLDIIGRNVNDEFVYPVQGVITRAVEDISNTLGNVISCLQTGGFVYLMKGPGVDPEIKMAKEKWHDYYRVCKDVAYNLPETPHQRRLVIYQKIKSAPMKSLDEDNDDQNDTSDENE